ncbi:MAG: hypothetical protein FJ004_09425 [Chloroflexi bacterium]|nr:hypothetical protein [Chloroflexota bacterium]
MIKDKKLLDQWYKRQLREEGLHFSSNIRILEAMYEEARMLGVFPIQDRLEGLERKIHLAKVVNVSKAAGKDSVSS